MPFESCTNLACARDMKLSQHQSDIPPSSSPLSMLLWCLTGETRIHGSYRYLIMRLDILARHVGNLFTTTHAEVSHGG